MSFSETLRKAKKSMVASALAVAAMIAPIKGQSQEARPEAESDKTLEASETQKERQQMLERAVKSGAPKEEIAKYVDFPKFFPVTQDGQFDEAKAGELAKALVPYVKALQTELGEVGAPEAYKIFKKTTGKEDVSFEDFQAVQKVAETAAKEDFFKGAYGATFMSVGVLTAGMAVLSGMYASDFKDYFDRKSIDPLALTGTAIAGVTALGFGVATVCFAGAGMEIFKRTPEQAVRDAYANAYKIHVDEAIKGQQKQFKILDMSQAKQLIQNIQGGKQ